MSEPVQLPWGALAYTLPIPVEQIPETIRDARRRLGSSTRDTVITAHAAIPETRTHLVVARDADLRIHLDALHRASVRVAPRVGDALREAREIRGLTQVQVATALGIHPAAVSHAECESDLVSRQVLLALLTHLQVDPSHLLPQLLAETEPLEVVALLEWARRKRGER